MLSCQVGSVTETACGVCAGIAAPAVVGGSGNRIMLNSREKERKRESRGK